MRLVASCVTAFNNITMVTQDWNVGRHKPTYDNSMCKIDESQVNIITLAHLGTVN